MPSSRTTSVSEPLAVSIRRHREVSKLSARSNPKASVRIYAHRGSLSKTTKHKMTNLFDKTLLLLVVVSCCGINASTNADDSTKVDAALQAACDTGRPFALRAGNYRVTRLLTCRLANGNGLLVNSLGVTIILDGQTAGIRISGTVGGTDENVFITGLKITAKSPVPFLLDLYGVAEIQLTNLRLDAKKLAPYALMMRAAQKGQISGGSILGLAPPTTWMVVTCACTVQRLQESDKNLPRESTVMSGRMRLRFTVLACRTVVPTSKWPVPTTAKSTATILRAEGTESSMTWIAP